jgi:NifU-like protein involved in Fe-S cluster formation
MTATCREACCSVTPRLTVSELFERGFRRNREAPLPVGGEDCRDTEGNRVRFSIDIAQGRVSAVGFRASSCATLIAYCELIAETVPGFGLAIAQALTPQDLVTALPGVPVLKQARAALAVAAFRSALAAAANELQHNKGEHRNEGRLYLRHPAP